MLEYNNDEAMREDGLGRRLYDMRFYEGFCEGRRYNSLQYTLRSWLYLKRNLPDEECIMQATFSSDVQYELNRLYTIYGKLPEQQMAYRICKESEYLIIRNQVLPARPASLKKDA